MTQVDERGHEGNTAVVTAYNTYVGGNMVKETAGQELLLTTIIYLNNISYSYSNPATIYHTRTAILLSSIITFEHYYTRTAVGRK